MTYYLMHREHIINDVALLSQLNWRLVPVQFTGQTDPHAASTHPHHHTKGKQPLLRFIEGDSLRVDSGATVNLLLNPMFVGKVPLMSVKCHFGLSAIKKLKMICIYFLSKLLCCP